MSAGGTARAAAFSWVMKDGLGRLGRFFVAAFLGKSFDSVRNICDAAIECPPQTNISV